MRHPFAFSFPIAAATAVHLLGATGCGGGAREGAGFSANDDASTGIVIATDAGHIHVGDGGISASKGGDGGSLACPSGYSCDVPCPAGSTTTITGHVVDPAGANPLHGVLVYVPVVTPDPLPRGVPTGESACSCEALYTGGAVASAMTGIDGSFTITNAPVGGSVELVVQIGKWRTHTSVAVAACGALDAGDIPLPSHADPSDSVINMPDIAVSTGGADSLECLMLRIGVAPSEYVMGADPAGHVHLFAGGETGGSSKVGKPAKNNQGQPASDATLWDSTTHLMQDDIVLLSCEGEETYDANPANLQTYLNAGGRVFASHFHYAWFSGPMNSKGVNTYAAPSDWGSNLATWSGGGSGPGNPDPGEIVTTLNVGGGVFAEGEELASWLGEVKALGQGGVPATDLSIYQPRYNAIVTSANVASQPWITDGTNTMYFSFDTPIGGVSPGEGPASYCGRAVFSDLHVAGDPSTHDSTSVPPPASCKPGAGGLSPQEKALEFMIYDLSACVTNVAVPDAGVVVSPPQ